MSAWHDFEASPDIASTDSQNRWTDAFDRKSMLGFLLLLAVALPVVLYRASLLSSFWVDEVYTIQMTHRSFPDIIEITSVDAHPPGYYFMLKCWLKAARTIGLPENIFVARAFNVPWWLLLAAAAWFGGRWLLGAGGGTLLGWIVALNPMICDATKDIRGYAVAVPALFTCFMIMQIAASQDEGSPGAQRQSRKLWAAYSLLALCAIWMHLFCSIVLALLGIAWILLVASGRGWRSSFAIHGFIAQAIPALSFLVWLPRVQHQTRYMQTMHLEWMTPATVPNYLSVFTYWYPLGKLGQPSFVEDLLATLLGIATVAVPVIWILLRKLRNLDSGNANHVRPIVVTGLLVPLWFVMTLWLIHASGIVSVFFAPRYPVLTCGMWLAGIVSLVWQFAPANNRTRVASLVLLPFVLTTATGFFRNIQSERTDSFGKEWETTRASFVDATKPIYVVAPELIPYYTKYLDGLDIRRIEAIDSVPETEENVQVLMLSIWPTVSFVRDQAAEYMMGHGDFSRVWNFIGIPRQNQIWALWNLEGFRHEDVRKYLKKGWRPPHPKYVPENVPIAFAIDQKGADGFGNPEYSGPLEFFRWGLGEESRIRFGGTLPAGRWKLHVNQFRHPYPTESITVFIRLDGRDDIGGCGINVLPGDQMLECGFKSKEDLVDPCFVLTQPIWRPTEFVPGAQDRRPLTFLFRFAWLEQLEEYSIEGS